MLDATVEEGGDERGGGEPLLGEVSQGGGEKAEAEEGLEGLDGERGLAASVDAKEEHAQSHEGVAGGLRSRKRRRC